MKDDDAYLDYLTGKDFSEGRFKNKELAEGWQRHDRAGAKAQAGDVTEQQWFIEAARREQAALRSMRRHGMALADVPLAGRRRR